MCPILLRVSSCDVQSCAAFERPKASRRSAPFGPQRWRCAALQEGARPRAVAARARSNRAVAECAPATARCRGRARGTRCSSATGRCDAVWISHCRSNRNGMVPNATRQRTELPRRGTRGTHLDARRTAPLAHASHQRQPCHGDDAQHLTQHSTTISALPLHHLPLRPVPLRHLPLRLSTSHIQQDRSAPLPLLRDERSPARAAASAVDSVCRPQAPAARTRTHARTHTRVCACLCAPACACVRVRACVCVCCTGSAHRQQAPRNSEALLHVTCRGAQRWHQQQSPPHHTALVVAFAGCRAYRVHAALERATPKPRSNLCHLRGDGGGMLHCSMMHATCCELRVASCELRVAMWHGRLSVRCRRMQLRVSRVPNGTAPRNRCALPTHSAHRTHR